MSYDNEIEEWEKYDNAQILPYNNNNSRIDSLQKWQLSIEEDLENMKRGLQGVVKNPNVSPEDPVRWIRVIGAESVNETGAIAIHQKISMYLTKISRDTNLSEEIIKRELMHAYNSFHEWLARRSVMFNVSNKDYEILVETFLTIITQAFYSSHKGWKGNQINASITTRETLVREQDGNRKSSGFTLPFSIGGNQ